MRSRFVYPAVAVHAGAFAVAFMALGSQSSGSFVARSFVEKEDEVMAPAPVPVPPSMRVSLGEHRLIKDEPVGALRRRASDTVRLLSVGEQ